jgi:hypothetical protein
VRDSVRDTLLSEMGDHGIDPKSFSRAASANESLASRHQQAYRMIS